MNKRDQAYIVLLCALIDLGGEGSKQDVLAYIQTRNFWYRNDANSPSPASRPNEFQWRNEIAYARRHMVDRNYIANSRHDWWEITNHGRLFFQELVQNLFLLSSLEGARFTNTFYNYICYISGLDVTSEEAADRLLVEQASAVISDPSEPIKLINEPIPRSPGLKRPGSRTYYHRSPIISQRALSIANYCCEINQSHESFLCRNLSHQYMEPHHLIPMQMSDNYDVSLDREQNIICLCSNCHRQIHYGAKKDVKEMISILFPARQTEICAILGQEITLEDLYQMYFIL